MSYYTAIIDRSEDGAFGASFPDLPGATAMADTLDEAIDAAREALRDWVEVAVENGVTVPAPRDAADIVKDADVKDLLAAGAILVGVPLVARRGRAVRVQITLDEGTLAAVDEAARRTKDTRSGFLARAAIAEIARA
ncbi:MULTISPECIES: type II toxin-antitoxin system HicB family antitoxin [unclassified Chelatococcus]|uniref:type II toxin-antitoxin system HicB family antitoxin n=1 Tax=unclassified Chelatococcus TaxID=2638111 RepID=UPI001BCECB27|nr:MULTISPECIES: type II toxin-antitoxin system HicB family antitoxin [unclassified Chelatococcus]CAH1665708.1 HicB-like domain-containing protein [Hyphomicrobiales bacterium]MBS7737759.1 type II toxin-antitoxin system HicB family antitoxin [Chelatococcus sp. HY11]MBX3547247.1 type II toxin-antitoxin system HicB family antitoxin [Chelatococcus sp.]MCO5077113.1 type II toxin-antitoxin system HicB family antitoxin [Chelatococcus sp.]CAH1681160.1 HicB-like domain-containing protein [Hyphomicrobia